MFLPLYDVVLIGIRRGDSVFGVNKMAIEKIEGVYKEVMNGRMGERPVDVFLSKIDDLLTEYEKDAVIVIRNLTEDDIKKMEIGRGRKTYPWKVFIFPKYPYEGEPIDIRELISVCPFLGTARRVFRYRSSSGG